MTRLASVGLTVMLGVLSAAQVAAAQEWRLELGANARLAQFRGVALDSVPGSEVLTGPTGGPITADSIIARCPTTTSVCYFYRPGETHRGGPLIASSDLSMWALGVRGLRMRLSLRAGTDLGDAGWPGLEPAVQLLEGYGEYAGERVTGRLGRQQLAGRLGWSAFDGARVMARVPSVGIDAELYGGLGLAQASALPVSSPALDPLDEFQPRRRQLVAGASLGWRVATADVRVEYQREVDRETQHFWSERAAMSGTWRLAPGWSLAGGTEYDISNSWFGTADIRLRYARRGAWVAVEARQYRPYFPLWTIWGAFSPVPYRAVGGSGNVTVLPGLMLSASTEYFRFAEAETETPLVQVDQDGWRSSIGAVYRPGERWQAAAEYTREYGPGASSDGVSASVSYRPGARLTVRASAASLIRPLEFRLDESSVQRVGLDLTWAATPQLSFGVGGAYVYESRERPDAAAFDWRQTRLQARLNWLLASTREAQALPPAIQGRRMGAVR